MPEINRKFLRIDLLRPGDVILTHGGAKSSKVIATGTRGRFSHASMFINGQVKLESTSDGVGYTIIKFSKIEYHPNYEDIRKCYWLLEDISSLKQIKILRHDDLKNENNEALSAKLFKLLQKDFGKEYSLKELAYASSKNVFIRYIVKTILSVVDRFRKVSPINPGPFCSMLIAQMYSELGIELFKRSRLPNETNPNDFVDSNLNEVRGVICNEDPTIENEKELLQSYNSFYDKYKRQLILPKIVRLQRSKVKLAESKKEAEDMIKKIENFRSEFNKKIGKDT